MIRTDIKKRKRRLVCDFHGSGFEFVDFQSFFTFALGIARTHSIFIIEIIHGKGKGADGLPFLPGLIDERLAQSKEIIHFERDPKNLGKVLVHLSSHSTVQKCNDSPFKNLRKIIPKRPQGIPSQSKKSDLGVQEFDTRINKVLKILETTWCEDSVKNLLEDMREAKCFREVDDFCRYINQFEVFFSDGFSQWLTEFYSSMN